VPGPPADQRSAEAMDGANGRTKRSEPPNNTTTVRGGGSQHANPGPSTASELASQLRPPARSGVSASRERNGAFDLAAHVGVLAHGHKGPWISGQGKKRSGASAKESSPRERQRGEPSLAGLAA
jgi:hypothetical protein